MTTVFLATAWTQYEGEDNYGVFSTYDLALAELARKCCEDGRLECRHDAHRVEEWEVDGNCKPHEVWSDSIEEATAAGQRKGGR